MAEFPFRFGPGECCCPCWVWADNFNRSNSTNVGTDWTEEVGDWEILSNRLHEKAGGGGTAAARIMGTIRVPPRSAGQMNLLATIISPTIGDVFYLYVAATDEDDDSTWARFTYQAANQWLVELSMGGAESSKVQNYVPGTPGEFPVSACIDDNAFKAQVVGSLDEFPWTDSGSGGAGQYYGLGHNNATNGATFDDFWIGELRTPTKDCVPCFCHCAALTVPRQLTLQFSNTTGNAACLGGDTITLDWGWGIQAWYGERAYTWVYGNHTYKWKLQCGSYDPAHPTDHFTLIMDSPQVCCATPCPALTPDPDLSTCDPLNLVFGPYSLTGGLNCFVCDHNPLDPLSGEFYVVISE